MSTLPKLRRAIPLVAILVLSAAGPEGEALAQAPTVAPVLIDEVVAVVAGKFQSSVPPRIVTRWDLEAECRLESIQRYGESGVDRPVSKSLRASVLERIIDDLIIAREAQRLEEAAVDPGAIDEALAQMAGEMSVDELLALLAQAGLTRAKVESILDRRIVAERYVLENLRLTLSLGESELESAFSSMNHPYAGSDLADVREQFREWLLSVKAVKHKDKLLAELRTRCRVWIFYSPGATES